MPEQINFNISAQNIISNVALNEKLPNLLATFEQNRQQGIKQFYNLDLAKKRAASAKYKVTENLDKYLVDFEASVLRKGGKVLWAYDAAIALSEIENILLKNKNKKVAKTTSALAEEIGLNQYFISKKINCKELSYAGYINETLQSKASHMAHETMLADKDELYKKLNQQIRLSLDADLKELSLDLQQELKKIAAETEITITTANFLIADSGMAVFCDNEGHYAMAAANNGIQIVLASIDSLIPSMSELELFLPLYASFSEGSRLNTYHTIVGPKLTDDVDGPSEFIVLLIDNGRSELLNTQTQREAMYCIGCGACYNVCPVFKHVGSAPYQNAIAGPIASATQPVINQEKNIINLEFASTSCGNCNKVCPVNIDLQNHIIKNRRENKLSTGNKLAWYTWKKFALNRKNMNSGSGIKGFTLKQLYKKEWGSQRIFPEIAHKTFNQLYREKYQLK
jgi:L-lactate dehydrogenase complex protein LldF